ncbi:MAG: hypothetical protein K6E60_04115, partial [Saccharofermentans sp.]|nr:hypothetical protein [Saccharofermentans sp.]
MKKICVILLSMAMLLSSGACVRGRNASMGIGSADFGQTESSEAVESTVSSETTQTSETAEETTEVPVEKTVEETTESEEPGESSDAEATAPTKSTKSTVVKNPKIKYIKSEKTFFNALKKHAGINMKDTKVHSKNSEFDGHPAEYFTYTELFSNSYGYFRFKKAEHAMSMLKSRYDSLEELLGKNEVKGSSKRALSK